MRDLVRPMTAWLVAACVVAACGGGGGGGGTGNPTITIAKASTLSGDAQTGQVAQALPLPLRVLVAEDGAALQGASVTWNTASGTIGPSPAISDANGIAVATWTLGNASGNRTATATLTGASGSPLTFTATATAGAAAALVKVAGDNQGEAINTEFGVDLQLRVDDQFGNPRPNTTVNWAGAGTVQPNTATSVTDAQGIATVSVTAQGAAGAGTVVASVTGLVTTQTFTFTVGHRKVTAAANLSFTSGRNATSDPAIDTIATNQTVVWVRSGGTQHTVRSLGSPSFASSTTFTVYSVTFSTAGTYEYDCEIHPAPAMNGRVVVE